MGLFEFEEAGEELGGEGEFEEGGFLGVLLLEGGEEGGEGGEGGFGGELEGGFLVEEGGELGLEGGVGELEGRDGELEGLD